ncbi:hypothetical protein [Dactylosporangium sp. NPDC051541]|uniref:hypothetical protein n=1 Tax=Dactylosporangium sp. NPDC051541 TaxID=3363977 RepID=UPI0037BC2884
MSTTSYPARRLRRRTMGTALILFPALLLLEGPIDPAPGGTGEVMFAAATQHRTALAGCAGLLLVSGVLMVPAAAAVLHQARDRGSALGAAAAVLAVLGGFGHAAIAMFYLIAMPLAGGDRAEMVAYIERLNASPVLGAVVFPLILCFALALLAMVWAAWRAGLIGWWGPAVVTAAVVAHEVLPGPLPGVELAGMGALSAVFGLLGVRVLRMTDAAWNGSRRSGAPLPAHA